MTVISVIVGSTREGRFSEKPAHWILQHLKKRNGVRVPIGHCAGTALIPALFSEEPQ